MYKKVSILLLVLLMVFTLVACSSPNSKENSNDPANNAGQQETPPAADQPSEFQKQQELEADGKGEFKNMLQEGGTAVDEFSLKIGEHTFTEKDAAELTVYTAEIEILTKVEAHQSTYVGYKLLDVLALYDLSVDADFYVVAADGYKITCKSDSLDENTLIALSKDGSTKNAPIYAPCSSKLSPNYVTGFAELRLN
ncbi:MAG TPA: hypothetical protein VFC74_03365 [Oscillospiraceae bacterium]|nr:hypothetical protein [Oscillospiraceae bacterium]